MKQLLDIICKAKNLKDGDDITEAEQIALYNETTKEEVDEYNKTIADFLEEKPIEVNALRIAVSYFYLTLYLKENNLI